MNHEYTDRFEVMTLTLRRCSQLPSFLASLWSSSRRALPRRTHNGLGQRSRVLRREVYLQPRLADRRRVYHDNPPGEAMD